MSDINIHKNSMAGTLAIMALSAALGGVIAVLLVLPAAITAVALMGPVAWLTLGPMLLAASSLSISYAIVGVPIWAIIGGFMFAQLMSGNGSVARQNKVIFFSSTHPIYIRTQELASKLNLNAIPFVGHYQADGINAFAMGTRHDNAMIAVSEDAVEKLSKEELDAVLAHELAHIANNDMARMTFLRGAQEALTFFLLFKSLKKFTRWIFTPLSEIEIMTFSRTREFAADAISAQITSPKDMAGALTAISNQQQKTAHNDAHQNIRFSGWNTKGLFRSHPPLEKRIAAIEQLLSSNEMPDIVTEIEPIVEQPAAQTLTKLQETEHIPQRPLCSCGGNVSSALSFGS